MKHVDHSCEVALCLFAVAAFFVLGEGTLEGVWYTTNWGFIGFFFVAALRYTWREYRYRKMRNIILKLRIDEMMAQSEREVRR